jgi:hypothetical protein
MDYYGVPCRRFRAGFGRCFFLFIRFALNFIFHFGESKVDQFIISFVNSVFM